LALAVTHPERNSPAGPVKDRGVLDGIVGVCKDIEDYNRRQSASGPAAEPRFERVSLGSAPYVLKWDAGAAHAAHTATVNPDRSRWRPDPWDARPLGLQFLLSGRRSGCARRDDFGMVPGHVTAPFRYRFAFTQDRLLTCPVRSPADIVVPYWQQLTQPEGA
jgi:hypothetical protein